MPVRKPTAIVQLKVRLREDLRRRLEREAERREDSINNEVVRRLEDSFKRGADQDLASEVRKLREDNESLHRTLDRVGELTAGTLEIFQAEKFRIQTQRAQDAPKLKALEEALSKLLPLTDDITANEVRGLVAYFAGPPQESYGDLRVISEREQQKIALGELRRGLKPVRGGKPPPGHEMAYGEAVGRLTYERDRGEITHNAFIAGLGALKPLVAELGRNEITPGDFTAAARAIIDNFKRKQTAGQRLAQPEKGETK
jgi:hypothetical protein